MVLHTLNATPSSAAFKDCVNMVQAGDAVVLLGDGVYAALAGTPACRQLQAKNVELFVLGTDALLAGITQADADIVGIDMDGLVALTERFARQLAWY